MREVSTLHQALEDPMPSNAGMGSMHPGPWIVNLDSGVVHRPDIQPPQWRTLCGWNFGLANTTGVGELPASSSLICAGCFKAEKAAARACELASSSSSSSGSESCAS